MVGPAVLMVPSASAQTLRVNGTAGNITVVRLDDGWFRVHAPVEHFHREACRIGPRLTDGWRARVRSLAKVVADEGTLELVPSNSISPRALT